jgi:outer membrane protein assembly factor BamA
LAGVKVVGSERFEEPAVIRATGLKIAGGITLEALKVAAERLGALGEFAEVRYSYRTQGEKLFAEFAVKDAAQFLPASFENLIWFTREDLMKGLRARVPLFDGQVPPGGTTVEDVSAALVAMLEEQGVHARVEHAPVVDLGGSVRGMQFKVIGIPMPVREIEFTGVRKVDPTLLQEAALPLKDRDFDFSFIKNFSNGGIARVYLQRGYLKVRFGDPIPKLIEGADPPNSVRVSIPVFEGEEYRLKEIRWSGHSDIPYQDLAKTVTLAPGTPVDAIQLEQEVLALPILLHSRGYLEADASLKPSFDEGALAASYEVQIRQGDLYKLGKLEIAGLDEAHAASLTEACRLQPGDPYDRTYWGTFIKESGRHLPAIGSGWGVTTQETIHRDTRSVDVKLIFAPKASR